MRTATRACAVTRAWSDMATWIGPALLVLLLSPSWGSAQPAVNTQRHQPMAGPRIGASLPDAQPLSHGMLALGLSTTYAHGQLNRGAPLSDLGQFTDLATAEVGAALGLFGLLELGVMLPFGTARLSPPPTQFDKRIDARFGLGDLRTSFKAALVRKGGFRLAATLEVALPTATPAYPFGDGAWGWMPGLVVRGRIGPLTAALRAAYRVRNHISLSSSDGRDALILDDAVQLAGALEFRLVAPLSLFAELTADLATRHRARGQDGVEVAGGMRLQVLPDLWLLGGAGGGLPGLAAAYGVPEVRVFAAAAFNLDAFQCAAGPEDHDGFRDGDGCADPDNDEDGIPDVSDRCENDAEDYDGFADHDGCPDRDNDTDGITDDQDLCPLATEDWDGFEDEDGCPEADNDQDGIADGYDVCAVEPEDRDGFEDMDGCPEPGPQPATVTVEGDRILVSEPIYFEDDRDVIRETSGPVLAQIAALIRALDDERQVLIVAHTDDAGRPEHNLDLSRRRADAVRLALIAQGAPVERLRGEGRGGTEPLADNDTPEGRAMNRRIELRLVPTAQNAAP